MTHGTVVNYPNFNPDQDAQTLRKAMKGLGTDEKAIIDVIANRSSAQRQKIKEAFKVSFGKDLIDDLKSELGGHFEDAVVALMMPLDQYDAYELKSAMKGAGTNEHTLLEILCTRNNQQIQAIKAAYKLHQKGDLEKDLMSETSGHFKRLLVSLAQGARQEGAGDPAKAKQDAKNLHEAGEKSWGTDESAFNAVLARSSWDHIKLVFKEYQNLTGHSLEAAIKKEFSGDIEDALLAVVKSANNLPAFFAECLHKSMAGAGTKDRNLIRLVVSRCEIDMVEIKQAYQQLYGHSLEKDIEGDISGDYKRLILALVRTK